MASILMLKRATQYASEEKDVGSPFPTNTNTESYGIQLLLRHMNRLNFKFANEHIL